jgi:DNA-directed RNA polymerase subunit K/omega
MLYPTIHQLTSGDFNRYELVIATAKCARMITDEYVRQRETAEKAVASGAKDGEKSISNMIDKEYRDEKAVKVAINHIRSGDFVLTHASDDEDEASVVAE